MMIDAGGAAFLAAQLIRKHEGLRLAPYFCQAGRLTVGYGHVILPHEGICAAASRRKRPKR